jgi:SAM-dependent methyltransferase
LSQVQPCVCQSPNIGREATFQRHLDHLESLIQPEGPHKLLDVGSHIGVFVQEARARGWDAHGLEPSAWAVEQAHAHGVPVIQGTLADVDPGREFDVVTLWDVIEHLADPLHELQRVAAIVRPGGWVCVHTMDVDSPFARLAGSRWPWFMQMHLYYFSRATLTAMLSRAGFRTVRAAARGRVLRLGYLVSRLTPYSQQLAGRIETAARALHLTRRLVPVNFGDLFTACARKE